MKEKYNIKNNTSGKVPESDKTVLRVTAINNPKEVLENCKNAVLAILNNPDLSPDSPDWEALLPETIVNNAKKLLDVDFAGDNFLFDMEYWVRFMKGRDKDSWLWYSSKINNDGFEIITTKSAFVELICLVHIQSIPLNNIYMEDDRFGKYTPTTLKEVIIKNEDK